MCASNETILTTESFECEHCGADYPASAYSDGYDNVPVCDDCMTEEENQHGCDDYDAFDDHPMSDADYDAWREQCEKADRNGTAVNPEFDDWADYVGCND